MTTDDRADGEAITLSDLLKQTKPLKFGDPVVCIFASEANPTRTGAFVRWKKSRHGLAEVTDRRGTFWWNGSVFHAEDAALFDALKDAIHKKLWPPSPGTPGQ